MQKESVPKLSRRTIAILVVLLAVVYLFVTAAIAQTGGTSGVTKHTYEVDRLSLGDVWQFDYGKTAYSTSDTKNIKIQDGSDKENTSTITSISSCYANVTVRETTVIGDAITTGKGADFFKNGAYTEDTVTSPVTDTAQIPVLTATGDGGVYTVIPNTVGTYRVYVHSSDGAPAAGSVSYRLADNYENSNALAAGDPFVSFSDFTDVGNGWYYATVSVETTAWTGWSVSCASNTDAHSGMGSNNGHTITDAPWEAANTSIHGVCKRRLLKRFLP